MAGHGRINPDTADLNISDENSDYGTLQLNLNAPGLRAFVDHVQRQPVPVSRETRVTGQREDGTFVCQRRGCGSVYRDETNTEHSCWFHPGAPIFVDGRKEWSCCGATGQTFSEFSALPGCLVAKHTQEIEEPTDPVEFREGGVQRARPHGDYDGSLRIRRVPLYFGHSSFDKV